MSKTVLIKDAVWRQKEISGTFPVVKDFRKTRDDGSGVITINAKSIGFPERVRLVVHPTQYSMNGDLITNPPVVSEEPTEKSENLREALQTTPITAPLDGDYNGETEKDAMNRINERFLILNEITEAVSNSHVKSVIVSGPPGVGKSFGVEEVLMQASVFDVLGGNKLKYEFVKGSISPPALYIKLHEFSDKNCVVVFDDCDDVLLDQVSLSLLKAALDTTTKRVLSWHKESHSLNREGIPDRFEFKGGIIFITNYDFTAVRSKVLKPHLDAMVSRCHYLTLDITTMRDKFLRIKSVVKDSNMLENYGFEENETDIIMEYVKTNVSRFNEVSLRTVLKIADLVKMKGISGGWERLVRATMMKKGS